MNRSNLRLIFAAFLGSAAAGLAAQQALEIIPLRHATVEQVLPVLRPLLEPGATLSGSRGQLFLRASPANVDDIRRALAAVDRPAKRLVISVRFEGAAERERRMVEGSGTVGSAGARVAISAQDSRRNSDERVDQRVQVLEGSRAMILAGRSTEYRDVASGFEVVPRMAGGLVHLDITQQRETGVQAQRLDTSVTVRLGEWTELGGIGQSGARDDRGIAFSGSHRSSGSRRVWLKVEEAAN